MKIKFVECSKDAKKIMITFDEDYIIGNTETIIVMNFNEQTGYITCSNPACGFDRMCEHRSMMFKQNADAILLSQLTWLMLPVIYSDSFFVRIELLWSEGVAQVFLLNEMYDKTKIRERIGVITSSESIHDLSLLCIEWIDTTFDSKRSGTVCKALNHQQYTRFGKGKDDNFNPITIRYSIIFNGSCPSCTKRRKETLGSGVGL